VAFTLCAGALSSNTIIAVLADSEMGNRASSDYGKSDGRLFFPFLFLGHVHVFSLHNKISVEKVFACLG